MRSVLFVVGVGCTGVGAGKGSGDTGAPPTEEDVRAAIEAANHCTVPADCTNLSDQCPFGCWILVNVGEAEAVQAEIDAYYAAADSTCTYSCEAMGEIRCDAGVCVADPAP